MEWLEKVPQWLKIPIKIMLPSLFIFSGILLLIDDNIALKLYLKEFRQNNGFALGLIFLITLSLIVVYIFVFASKPLIAKIKVKINKANKKKQIANLSDAEKFIVYGLYNEPTHAFTFPINDPTVNLLKIKGFLFTYTQEANLDKYYRQTGLIFVLQPMILECLEKMFKKISSKYSKAQKMITKCKNADKKKNLQKYLTRVKKITSISLDKYYKGVY